MKIDKEIIYRFWSFIIFFKTKPRGSQFLSGDITEKCLRSMKKTVR